MWIIETLEHDGWIGVCEPMYFWEALALVNRFPGVQVRIMRDGYWL